MADDNKGMDWAKIGTSVLTGGLTGGITSAIGGLFSKDEPSVPAPMTAEEMKSRMETLYPGTSSYERLAKGGGGVPQASASQDQAKIAGEMQRQQHRNQMQITRANNAALIRQAEINKQASNYSADQALKGSQNSSFAGIFEKYGNKGIEWYNKNKDRIEGKSPQEVEAMYNQSLQSPTNPHTLPPMHIRSSKSSHRFRSSKYSSKRKGG